jgi:hypothetical protein
MLSANAVLTPPPESHSEASTHLRVSDRIIAFKGKRCRSISARDHDPLYRFHPGQAHLRVLEVMEIKTVP